MIPAPIADRFVIVAGYYIQRHEIDRMTESGVLLKDGRHITRGKV